MKFAVTVLALALSHYASGQELLGNVRGHKGGNGTVAVTTGEYIDDNSDDETMNTTWAAMPLRKLQAQLPPISVDGIPHCSTRNLPSLASDVNNPNRVISQFVAMGDIPYYESERYCLNHQLRNLPNITPPDQPGPSFLMHVGDIKKGIGGAPCNEDAYDDVAEIFTHTNNAISYDPRDVFFTPGDNEWVDCSDPDDAWEKYMRHFGPRGASKFGTFSHEQTTVVRQTEVQRKPGVTREENFCFFMHQILYCGINMIGGPPIGDEAVRLHQNFEFIKLHMGISNLQGMKAAVIFGHAPLDGARKKDFGAKFQRLLVKRFSDLPVLYLHGNGHVFCVHPMRDYGAQNLYDLEVEAGDFAPPILVSVVENPVDGAVTFEVDQRGGLFYPAGQCPVEMEKTWMTSMKIGIPEGDEPGGGIPVPLDLPDMGELTFFKGEKGPFGPCEGHCSSNKSCIPGLKCRYRTGYEEVDGCSGLGKRKRNYCFDKNYKTMGLDSPYLKSLTTLPLPLQQLKQGTSSPTTPGPGTTSSPTSPGTGTGTTSSPTSPGTASPSFTPSGTPSSSPSTIPSSSPTAPQTNANGDPLTLKPTAPYVAPELTFYKDTTGRLPLGLCEGHCKRHKDCLGDLKCKFRKGTEDVPGCLGPGRRKRNFCYDPKWKPVAPAST